VAGRCGAAHEHGSLQLRPKARLVVELEELALLYAPSDGLLLQHVWGFLLFLWRWHPIWDLLRWVNGRSVVILLITEEARSAPRAWLVGRAIPPLRVHGEGRLLV
jgi:hypothetical protein